MPQPMTLPNYSHMEIRSHEEIIEEHIMKIDWLIICLTIDAGCDIRLQGMASWLKTMVMEMVVAMEM